MAPNLLQIMDFMNTDIDILLQKSASFTKTFQNVIWSISDDYNMFICVVETSGSHRKHRVLNGLGDGWNPDAHHPTCS